MGGDEMSGGSLDYACYKMDSIIEEIEREAPCRGMTVLHKAFVAHLKKVSKALHDLEWVYSADYGPGDEEEAIKACINWKKESISVIREQIELLKREIELLDNQTSKK
jgi:hypothetical protein